MATNTFFDEDSHENAEVREREPVEETGQGPGQDELVPAVQDPDDLPPVATASSSSKKRTGYRTLTPIPISQMCVWGLFTKKCESLLFTHVCMQSTPPSL